MGRVNPPKALPLRIGWLVMGTESHGVYRITTSIWNELSRRGSDLRVMSVRPGTIADAAMSSGLPTAVLLPELPIGPLMTRVRRFRAARLLADNIRVAKMLRRRIMADDLDLIQLSDIDLAIATRLAAWRTGAKICYLTPNRPPEHRIATWAIPRVLGGRRTRVLANSEDIRRRFAAVGVRSTTLLLGIDVSEFTPPDEATAQHAGGPARLVTIGRVCKSKAQDLWAAAAIELNARGLDVTLTIVGADHFEPEFTAALHALVEGSAFGDQIEFTGERSDIMQILARSDVALCGTREIEAFGLAAVEALACERPVVVIGEGGIREIVADGETGWFVPSVDLDGVVAALQRCCDDRPRWAEMGRKGRATVLDLYTVERVIDRYLDIVSEPWGPATTSRAASG